ncbi:MAG: Uncharacterized protein XD63_0035 [Thermoanaerobacterales bacterium 50_218]|nr:MAG: Uncharacterized protein XD63_0035 [Thermoanaerobacterales bacterium 50_218]HAA90276.1 hypothetical protein [Peptococcaceae bacterium]
MKSQVLDVVCLPVDVAKKVLEEAGYQVVVRTTGTSWEGGKRKRVLRQRLLAERQVEVVVAAEYYDDPALEIGKGEDL